MIVFKRHGARRLVWAYLVTGVIILTIATGIIISSQEVFAKEEIPLPPTTEIQETESVTPKPTPTPTLPAIPVVKVTKPRQAQNDFQAGVAVLVYGNDQKFEVKTRKLFDRLASLKVNSLSLVFPLFQDNWTSSTVWVDKEKTPSEENLRLFIREAHKRGFTVMLKPLLDEKSFKVDEKWRGSIQPDDRTTWFESYTNLILDYAKLAQEEDVEIFDIGTEFTSLEKETEQWQELIQEVRKIFSGQVTYSSNWDNYQNVSFWEELDFIGIDAFFPLDAPNEATIEQLIIAWQPWVKQMEKFRALSGKEIVLTELGTRSQLGSFQKPYVWYATGVPIDLETQRKYYEASWLATKDLVNGIYWWAVALELPKDPYNDPGFNPLGKPAEQEIAKCYKPD